MESIKTFEVTSCGSCPLRTTDGGGLGTVMICGHPKWEGRGYDAAIVSWTTMDSFPEKCPLKEEELKITSSYKINKNEKIKYM